MTEKEQLREQIEVMEAIERLYENKDFNLVILNKYLNDECAKAIKLSTYPTQNKDEHIAKAQAAGYLEQYLTNTVIIGKKAKEDIVSLYQDI